ncbi:MAG: hypothetical protein RL375_4908, partial [Pseudomonadota bacterium]
MTSSDTPDRLRLDPFDAADVASARA